MRTTLPTCGFLLLFMPGALHAQARPDTATARLDSIAVTASRAPATVGGASVLVVRQSALAFPAPPAASLSDILREVPFVLIRQNSRGEHEISMRGAESRQAAVLVDGVPVTLGWDGRVDPSLLPLTGVRWVSITRGLASLSGGPNVLGGVIELGFADQGFTSPATPDQAVTTGIDDVGARAVSVAGGTRMRTRLGALSLRAGVSQRTREGFALSRGGGAGDGLIGGTPDPGQDGKGRLRSNSDLEELDVFAAVRLSSGAGRYAGITVTGFEAERGVPAELHVVEPRFWRYPEVSRRLMVGTLGTGVSSTPFGMGSLTASVGVSRGSIQTDSYTDDRYTTITTTEFGDGRTTTLRVLGTHSFGIGGQLRATHTRATVRYDERFDAGETARYRQTLGSSALEAEWTFLNGAQLTAGVAYDRAETPESGGREPLGGLGKEGWRLGASTTGFGEAVRFHASLSQRSRFPSLRELYSGALNRFVPNPNLRPETLVGAEVGATISGGAVGAAGITLQTVVFAHVLDDAVVRVTLPDRRFQRRNEGGIRSRGIEVVADWSSAAQRGGGSGGWTVSADLLLQRVRAQDALGGAFGMPPRHVEHQPEIRGSADVGAPLLAGLRAALGIQHTGKQFCQHRDQGELVELSAQAAGHLALTREWRVNRWRLGTIRALLAVENLSDATVYDQCGLPQPGRTVRVGVELR
ncbi:MAG: TonB-dependent receptor plug domain-containing protein [Gemmatimonadales bacterium]